MRRGSKLCVRCPSSQDTAKPFPIALREARRGNPGWFLRIVGSGRHSAPRLSRVGGIGGYACGYRRLLGVSESRVEGKDTMVSSSPSAGVVRSDLYDAWLFDLDGVITRTARVHARAWKRTFDEYLQHVADRTAAPFVPFEIDPEYYSYVDGKPRYEGVDSFLRSRGIALEWGDPGDAPNVETVCGIGNRKNSLFQQVLERRGRRNLPGLDCADRGATRSGQTGCRCNLKQETVIWCCGRPI
jgi:hypothetical protein